MQRCFRLRNLDFRRGEPQFPRPVSQPAGEKRFAAAVLSADGLEDAAAGAHLLQFVVERGLEPIQAHGERIKAAAGNGAPPECVNDLLPSLWTDAQR